MIRAILMAAGVGSRISRSINKPKSTLKVGDTPLIRRTVTMLLDRGIKVAVVIGFKGNEVRAALKGLDVEFYENPFYRVTNSMASLWFARDFLNDEDLILANADVYWGDGIYESIVSCDAEISMLADESRVECGDFFFNVVDGILTDYGKELTLDNRTTEYVGIAKLKGDFIPTFKDRLEAMVSSERYDLWWENVLYEYNRDTPIRVVDVSPYFWAEIDYIDDYQRILNYIDAGDISLKYREILR